MNLTELVIEECVDVDVPLEGKDAALSHLVQVAKRAGALQAVDTAQLLAAFKERESIGTTAFGNGVAIPHCRLPMVSKFVVGLVTVPNGVDFEAMDGQPVRLFVFIVAPKDESNQHIRVLSEISSVLRAPGVTDEMLAARAAEALRESFLRHSRGDAPSTDKRTRQLFHVYVQSEDLFRQILEIFVAEEPDVLTIIDGRAPAEYMSKMPLFAGFWTDRETETCRIIVAMVDKGLTNETIRRIEGVTGRLDESRQVVVSVQDVFFCSGSLANGQ